LNTSNAVIKRCLTRRGDHEDLFILNLRLTAPRIRFDISGSIEGEADNRSRDRYKARVGRR
jgi:hypothetical protein